MRVPSVLHHELNRHSHDAGSLKRASTITLVRKSAIKKARCQFRFTTLHRLKELVYTKGHVIETRRSRIECDSFGTLLKSGLSDSSFHIDFIILSLLVEKLEENRTILFIPARLYPYSNTNNICYLRQVLKFSYQLASHSR